MFDIFRSQPLPRILIYFHFDFLDVPVSVKEMRTKQQAEFLRRLDAVLLRQNIHRILLRVRRNYIPVIAFQVI